MIPGEDQKITNTDEQEVAVNSSSADDGGYDEPVDHSKPESSVNVAEEKMKRENKEEDVKRASPPGHHFKAN